jgi:hypothetical protein
MSFIFEKGTNDLVISGFEQGIADSPFLGIANIQNLNVSWVQGIAYVNYKRQACYFIGGTLQRPISACVASDGTIFISDFDGTTTSQIWKQNAVNGSTFTLLNGANYSTRIYNIQYWNNYLIVFRNNVIEICGDGGSSGGVNSGNWDISLYTATKGYFPFKITSTVTTTTSPSAGATSVTISSYSDGVSTCSVWNGPTGTYFADFTGTYGTQTVIASMVTGSNLVQFTPALNTNSGGAYFTYRAYESTEVAPIYNKNSLVSINDGNLYFCNGNYVGTFYAYPFTNVIKADFTTFQFNAGVLGLPKVDGAICLAEARNLLLVAGYHKIYPWDRVSPQWQNPIPLHENISSMINILNNVYILAGNKGNIYISNGYNAELFKKIPDHLSGLIDPQWTFGGRMENRNNLYFQATATNSYSGSNIFVGIFKLNISAGALQFNSDTTGALTIDSQYSGGLNPAGLRTDTAGLLINNNNIQQTAYDNYYSAYSATTNSIDYNSVSLWDIVPIGTSVQPKTFASAEFKFDQPMTSGDSITMYARQSLSDTYTLLGTTTTTVLSDFYDGVSFEAWQWIQFKVVLKTNGSPNSSSRCQLREIRIR